MSNENVLTEAENSAIRTAAQNRYGDKTVSDHLRQSCFQSGAEWGILQERKARVAGIERLKALIKQSVVGCACVECQKIWDDYKKENNL